VTAELETSIDDLMSSLGALAALETSVLWLLCKRLPLGDGPGRGELVCALLAANSDFVDIDLPSAGGPRRHAYLLSSMTNPEAVSRGVVAGLSAQHPFVTIPDLTPARTYGEALLGILAGRVLVLADGTADGLLADARGFATRQPETPVLETVVRGPHEVFVEDLATNMSLIRRRTAKPLGRADAGGRRAPRPARPASCGRRR